MQQLPDHSVQLRKRKMFEGRKFRISLTESWKSSFKLKQTNVFCKDSGQAADGKWNKMSEWYVWSIRLHFNDHSFAIGAAARAFSRLMAIRFSALGRAYEKGNVKRYIGIHLCCKSKLLINSLGQLLSLYFRKGKGCLFGSRIFLIATYVYPHKYFTKFSSIQTYLYRNMITFWPSSVV